MRRRPSTAAPNGAAGLGVFGAARTTAIGRPPEHPTPDDPIAAEVAHLGGLDVAALRQKWRKLMRQDAPTTLSRHVLCGMLAYRIQANAFGDLDRETVRFLDEITKARAAGNRSPVLPVGNERIGRLKPGTMLVREHEGTLHRVMVMADGFAWNGSTYDSLSSAARAITGTNWNGPRFFGLRERTKDIPASRAARSREARP